MKSMSDLRAPLVQGDYESLDAMPGINYDEYGVSGVVQAEPVQLVTSCFCSSKPAPPEATSGLVLSPVGDLEAVKVQSEVAVKRALVVVNPFSGNGRGARAWAAAKEVFQAAELAFEVVETTHAGHATELVREYDFEGVDALVVVGGDGTFHEVIKGIQLRVQDEEAEEQDYVVERGAPPPLGLIAGGTGNSVLVSLEETDAAEAARTILRGCATEIDLARVRAEEGVFYSLNIVAWGLGADANETAESCRCCGQLRYDCAALVHICKNTRKAVQMVIDGQYLVTGDYAVAMVQNNQHSGVKLRIAPYAKLNDGRMDLVMYGHNSCCATLDMFDQVKANGSHVFTPGTEYVRLRSLEIRTPGQKKLINVDGENIASTPCYLEVLPRALPIFFNPDKNQ